MARARTFWLRWAGDQGGIAAVEFALIASVMTVMFLGGLELCEAAATNRKVMDTTVELANVVAQYQSMSANDVSSVMNASAQIMAPYPTSSLSIVISEITTDANNAATVTWSRASNGGVAQTVGASVTLPNGLATPSTSFMFVKTNYAYTPTFGAMVIPTINMSDQLYILPRQSTSIPFTG